MDIQTVKNYIIYSIASTMFIGFGFGIAIASPIPVISTGGFVMGIISLIVMYTLLRKVEKTGYKINVVNEGNKNE